MESFSIRFAEKLLQRLNRRTLFTLLLIFAAYLRYTDCKESPLESSASTVQLNCTLSPDIIDEIAGYKWLYQNLSDLIINGYFKGETYKNLAQFVDTFGSRQAGTENLEHSIDYLVEFLHSNGLENVHTENATIPRWVRGNESLVMLQPRYQKLSLLGLGTSIGTPAEGITAEIIVVKSFKELEERASEVAGKIVVYNEPFITYGYSVPYRESGAVHAARHGAVASLIRSLTPNSIYTPHTGWQGYVEAVPKIPSACITVEDAEMFQRIADRGTKVTLRLNMEAHTLPDVMSKNAIGEWSGATKPDEVVIVSGHMDSWDVGQGALDDGGGLYISLMVPIAFKELGLRPRRTIRAIGWTSEEMDYDGAHAYLKDHYQELKNFDIVMESDGGTFDPVGLSFAGNNQATCIVQEVLKLVEPLGASTLRLGEDGSDSAVFSAIGVPTAALEVQGNRHSYFDYHHSPGDTMTVLDSDELDRCLVVWAVTSYVFADLSVMLPRDNNTSSS